MFNPPHPGFTLRDVVLPALGLSITDAAQQLDVTRVTLSRVLNGRSAISPEMAFTKKHGRVLRTAAGLIYGEQNKVPMTCGKPNRRLKRSRCMYAQRQ